MPLALMALVGTLGFNFQVVLPLLAKFSFDGGAGAYAVLVSAMGVGSIAGALVTGAHGRTGPRLIAGGALAFGVARPALGGDARAGARDPDAGPARRRRGHLRRDDQLDSCSSRSSRQMRGRVMALYSVVFLGSTPIGGPLTGWLSEAYDPRVALLLAGDHRPLGRLGGPRLLRPDRARSKQRNAEKRRRPEPRSPPTC